VRIENDFNVPAAPPETYGLLIDLERVGPCIPGGEVGRRSEDGSHPATIAVKLGPMRMNYRGTVRIEEQDDAAHRATLVADVREQRGQGSAKARMTMAVAADGGASRVETVTDVTLTGRAAQMGRGVVDDVAARLVEEMAQCVAARFGPGDGGGDAGGPNRAASGPVAAGPEAGKPIGGLRLMARVLWARLKRAFQREGGETS
jgi:carbon monoxide dehydrogenase subunit G